jgi:hypothetical protein
MGKQVAMKSKGYEKLRVTVMLCMNANGNTLPTYVILNRKTTLKENLCRDVIRSLGPTKCMDHIAAMGRMAWMCMGMSAWCINKATDMLAMAAFRGPLYNGIRNRLRNKNAALVIIPRAMTNQVQPLDMSITRSFKHLVRTHYSAWLNKYIHILTLSGKIKKASASVILEWISKAWKEVPGNIIPKLFSKCYLFNAEDGMQDDNLWDYSGQSGEAASSAENESATEGSLNELSD